MGKHHHREHPYHLVQQVMRNEHTTTKDHLQIIEMCFKEIKKLKTCFQKKRYLRYKMHSWKLSHTKLKSFLIHMSVNYWGCLTLSKRFYLKILFMKETFSCLWLLRAKWELIASTLIMNHLRTITINNRNDLNILQLKL